MLLRDGAVLIRDASDVIDALPKRDAETTPSTTDEKSMEKLQNLNQLILSRLGQSPLAEDQLIRDLTAPSKQVSSALVDLEIRGKICRAPGGLLSLAS